LLWAQFEVIDLGSIGSRPVVAVVILYAQNCEVRINGVRRVLINVVEMKADSVAFAHTASVRVRLQ
jgi:hypothetical protein